MGDLTILPNELICEILKYLNVFEKIDFSKVNRSCRRFITGFEMVPNNVRVRFLNFLSLFKEKQSILNVEKALEYNIPVVKGQQFVIYPTKCIPTKKIEMLVRKGVVVKFQKDSVQNTTWGFNDNLFPNFEKDFVYLNKAMKHIIHSKMIDWNVKAMYLYVEDLLQYLDEYRLKYPDRIMVPKQ
jgi:hypothetical protein